MSPNIRLLMLPVRLALALAGVILCVLGRVHWRTSLLAFALWPFTGFGVTAGAHRLWTHGSFKPTVVMELLLILMFSMADQGSITAWSLTHKQHHRHSDTDKDPHNRNRGFWYSHFGWVLSMTTLGKMANVDMLHLRDRIHASVFLRVHDQHSVWWDPLCALGLPALLAHCWGDALGGLLVAGALRWLIVQHFTFFVNSMAHGEPNDEDMRFDAGQRTIGPRLSLVVTFCALGEGWHDYHHEFPWDYAAAELDAYCPALLTTSNRKPPPLCLCALHSPLPLRR